MAIVPFTLVAFQDGLVQVHGTFENTTGAIVTLMVLNNSGQLLHSEGGDGISAWNSQVGPTAVGIGIAAAVGLNLNAASFHSYHRFPN